MKFTHTVLALGLLAGASSSAFAQTTMGAPGSATRMQAERATCDGVQQDKAACLREAGAAKQAAGKGDLRTDGRAGNNANASARCDLQPAADRADCEARLRGAPGSTTTTSGSVMGGGVIRETVTPVPAK
ncbi:MAG: hypothetical protein EOO26_13195 [Comamonadaceae bacterium]|nr:MAG: hypothetical protein EOO26_13195 [Comamonadaceae bacterium]